MGGRVGGTRARPGSDVNVNYLGLLLGLSVAVGCAATGDKGALNPGAPIDMDNNPSTGNPPPAPPATMPDASARPPMMQEPGPPPPPSMPPAPTQPPPSEPVTPIENVGDACASTSDCLPVGVAVCLTTVLPGLFSPNPNPVTYPGGYCSQPCESDAACGPLGGCPGAGGLPIPLPLPLPTGDTNCLKKCVTEIDCREGYECRMSDDPLAGFGGGPIQLYCQPALEVDEPDDPDAGAGADADAGVDAG